MLLKTLKQLYLPPEFFYLSQLVQILVKVKQLYGILSKVHFISLYFQQFTEVKKFQNHNQIEFFRIYEKFTYFDIAEKSVTNDFVCLKVFLWFIETAAPRFFSKLLTIQKILFNYWQKSTKAWFRKLLCTLVIFGPWNTFNSHILHILYP